MKSSLRPLYFVLLLVLTAPLASQDKVTLTNGDRLTGTLKTMADGAIVFHSSALRADITIPLATVQDLVTTSTVTVVQKSGDKVESPITGIQDGQLQMGENKVDVQQLAAMNPPAKKPVEWTGSINVGAQFAQGNTDRRSITATANAQRRSAEDRITADFSWNYAEERNDTPDFVITQRRTSGAAKYDYFVSKKAYVYSNIRAVNDELANLALRFLVGGGGGYQLYERPDFKWGLEAGINYVSEDYNTAGSDADYVSARVASSLNWQITDRISFLQDVEWLPGLENSEDQYVLKNTRLQLSLTDSMFAQLGWELEWDNTPALGAERTDNRYAITVGWSF